MLPPPIIRPGMKPPWPRPARFGRGQGGVMPGRLMGGGNMAGGFGSHFAMGRGFGFRH